MTALYWRAERQVLLSLCVVPAQAGTQDRDAWIPAFAGMTALWWRAVRQVFLSLFVVPAQAGTQDRDA